MGKYLKFYRKYASNGILPHTGLCNSLGMPYELTLFEQYHPQWGYSWCWAFDGENDALTIIDKNISKDRYCRSFTPLRQNIVLLIAAMNDEL